MRWSGSYRERDSSTSKTTLSGSSTSYAISGLRGESNYTIAVTAVNVAGSATSEPVTQLTGETGILPSIIVS